MKRKTPREDAIESCKFISSETELLELAKKVRETFPAGMNRNTNTPNRQPARQLADALLRFSEYYDLDITGEDIVNAAIKYNMDKKYDPYRQSSQYFIIKDLTREGRGITSALATYIEMAQDSDESNSINSWLDDKMD